MDLSHGFNRFSKRGGLRRDVGIPGTIPRCRYQDCRSAGPLSLTVMTIDGIGMPMLVCENCRESQYGPREVTTIRVDVIPTPNLAKRRNRK